MSSALRTAPSLDVGGGSWLRQAVIYQILLDRFAGCDPRWLATSRAREGRPVFCGGDLFGLACRMPYLQALGVSAVWVSPFTQNAAVPTAYHGYHTTDLYQVDPRFGGDAGLDALVKAAGAAGIRVIMDFVANHVHRDHRFFRAAAAGPAGGYRDWFCRDSGGRVLSFLHFTELPKLNLDHPAARRHVIGAAEHWLDRGIAGFRCDHALGPSLGFWRDLRHAVKRRCPEAVLIGEVAFVGIRKEHLQTLNLPHKETHFAGRRRTLETLDATLCEYADVFDGLLDFYFQEVVKTRVGRPARAARLTEAQGLLDRHYARYPAGCALLSFLDNHDQPRFLFEASQRRDRLIAAIRFQFQQPQPPVIYYGTELAMSQQQPFRGPHSDLKCRRVMRWDRGDAELLGLYRSLIAEWKSRKGSASAGIIPTAGKAPRSAP